MNRQYIGARYVPKFAETVEWVANTSYEALTIVTYNNASYTSKKPVPPTVGNPSENGGYWALTGNYNAQVEEYRRETNKVKTTLDSKIKYTGSKRKFIVIADSYGVGTQSWIEFLKISRNLVQNQDIWSNAIGGAGFSVVNPNGVYINMLKNLTSTLTQQQIEGITDIIVQGSVNDAGQTTENITNGYIQVENYVKTTFPNATLYVPLLGYVYTATGSREKVFGAYNTYMNVNSYANISLFAFKPLLSPMNLRSDRVHPTQNGSKELAAQVNSMLNGLPYSTIPAYYRTTFVNTNNSLMYVDGHIINMGWSISKNDVGRLSYPDTIQLSNTETVIATCTIGTQYNQIFMNNYKATGFAYLEYNQDEFKTAAEPVKIHIYPNEDYTVYNLAISLIEVKTINASAIDLYFENTAGIFNT